MGRFFLGSMLLIFQGWFFSKKTYLPILATPWHCDGRYPAPHRSARRCAPAREGLGKLPLEPPRAGGEGKNSGKTRENTGKFTIFNRGDRYICFKVLDFFLIVMLAFFGGGGVRWNPKSWRYYVQMLFLVNLVICRYTC